MSWFDMSDPCSPEKVGEGFHLRMRESHSIGMQYLSETEQYGHNRILGIQFWDIQNLETPEMINYMTIDGVFYPDSYTRVVLSIVLAIPLRICCRGRQRIFHRQCGRPQQSRVGNPVRV